MPKYYDAPVHNKNSINKKKPYFKIHIMRRVAPGQEDLEKQIDSLSEHTQGVVNYKTLGNLGVTLVMLEPIIHKIMNVNRHEKIKKTDLDAFADELNTIMGEEDCTIPLADTINPYGIYGRGKRYLGIQLSRKSEDSPLYGDRAKIVKHIASEYPVTSRFMRDNTVNLKPHITLGQVVMGNLDEDDRVSINMNPNKFIDEEIRRFRNMRERYGLKMPDLPVIPELITLNGLRAVVERG